MSASNKQTSRKEKLASMPVEEQQQFIELLNIQSNSDNERRMLVYLYYQLAKMKDVDMKIDEVGNILITKGNAATYPCIVAHMDTVHPFYDDYRIKIKNIQKRQIAYAYSGNKQVGTGGDDKCGIYAVLFMLRRFPAVKAAFFTQEETGLIGSGDVDKQFFSDCGYIIQLDRWGRSDLICRKGGDDTVSKEFLKMAEQPMRKYGYHKEQGLITDSINLWSNGIGLSCVNVSCGYYQHHTPNEIIDLNEFWNSLLFTRDLIDSLGHVTYPSKPTPTRYGAYDDWDWDYGSWSKGRRYGLGKQIGRSFGTSSVAGDLLGDDDSDAGPAISENSTYFIQNLEFDFGVSRLTSLQAIELNDALIMFNEWNREEGFDALTHDEFQTLLDEHYADIDRFHAKYKDDYDDNPF